VRSRASHAALMRGDRGRSGCGLPAGMDRDNPPVHVPAAPYKTHLEYVRERRSEAEAEMLPAQALARLRPSADPSLAARAACSATVR